MSIGTGGAALLGAAMPGVAGAIGDSMQTTQNQKQANGMLSGTQDMINNDSQVQGLQDPNHPVWNVMNNLTGSPSQGIPTPQFPAAQSGAALPSGNAIQALQNGGVVRRLNYGKQTTAPSFERGPALPVGPNNTIVGPTSPPMQGMAGYAAGGIVGDTAMGQGISPASTEGQILTFDTGGVVPQGIIPQPGITGVPMNGGAAALVQGLQAGQNLGSNLYQAWADGQNNKKFGVYADQLKAADVDSNSNGTATQDPQGVLSQAKDSVEGFFHHLFSGTLDENHKPNGDQAIPGATTPADGSALPANQPGTAPTAAAGAAPAPSPIPGGSAAASPNAAGPTANGAPGVGSPQQGQQGPQGSSPVAPPTPAQDPNMLPEITVQAAKTIAASEPNVAAGIPSVPPEQSGKAHSLTPEYWDKLNQAKWQAVKAAQRAGEDPAKVYESMTAMQNAHFQGQILKQLGTANVAFQNGDMKSVEQALKNVNYYLPNGQDIQFKKATAADVAADPSVKIGDLMYKNPFYGMYGHQNDPEYTKVDQQHIQSLGAAALDPRTVQDAQLKSYSAQMDARRDMMKAQGDYMTGQGRQLAGAAAYGKMSIQQQMEEVDRRLKIAAGNKDQAEANWYNVRQPANTGRPQITLASLRSYQNDASAYTDRIVQGQPTTAPVLVKDPDTGQMVPNLSPGAGKSLPDASRIPAWMTNGKGADGKPIPLTSEQQENVKVLGGQINSANAGLPGMNTPKAVELAARITHYQSHPTTHIDPDTGKPAKDFVYDPKNGTAHVWVGNAYESVYLSPNVADESGAAGGSGAPPPGGNSAPNSGGGENDGPDPFQ